MPIAQKESLGDRLKETGRLSADQLIAARAEEQRSGEALSEIVVRKGWMTDEEMAAFLAEWLSLPLVDLKNTFIEPELVKLVPEEVARKHRIVPVFRLGNSLTVAVADPFDLAALDAVRRRAQMTVDPALAARRDIEKALDQIYASAAGRFEDVLAKIDPRSLGLRKGEEPEARRLRGIAEEAPVIKMVNLLFAQAVRERASDIHVEPGEERMRIRYRIDGMLQEIPSPAAEFLAPVISRIKIMANLDIAERRIPQDGRFQLNLENRTMDVRVSIVPTINGEKAVLRLLDPASLRQGLENLGFSGPLLESWKRVLAKPYGLLLTTGPTGSGKTTTLYTSLQHLNNPDKHIITIEDPVEYRLAGVQQIQVNAAIDLTFSSGLRSILRQDPNIVMVGEIRDRETAEIAVHAALTGHLVFSTLHTNDAPGAVTRLIDIGVEPFLAASSLQAVLAQRLLRLLCPACKAPAELTAELAARLGIASEAVRGGQLFRAAGCPQCHETGYKGRVAVFELFLPDDEIRAMIAGKPTTERLRELARSKGMTTLRDSALALAKEGTAALEEVLRITLSD